MAARRRVFAATVLGFCICAAALLGPTSIPSAIADGASGTITLAEAKKQLAQIKAEVESLGTKIQQSEDVMNEALVQQASLQDQVTAQQAKIDVMAPEYAQIVNAQRQSNKWADTVQFLLDDNSTQFIEHMDVTASVWATWTEQMIRLGDEKQRLDDLGATLKATISSVTAEVEEQKILLKQQQSAEAESKRLISTLTYAQQQAVGSPSHVIKPQTLHMIEVVNDLFPQIKTIYTLRSGSNGDHGNGLAADFMIPNYRHNVALGWKIAHYAQDHAKELGVQYVIYQQSIWNISRASEGWRPMASRGNDTANHRDHVHVSMKA